MTRGELAHEVAREISQHGADREWICSLLDRALAVGQQEIRGRVRKTLGPFVAATATDTDNWAEAFDMDTLMPPPVKRSPGPRTVLVIRRKDCW